MNIDNLMDDLISRYSEDDIRDAYEAAVKRSVDNKRQKEITDKRSKVLAALTDYFISVWGKADKDLIKEFEKELIDIEKKAGTSDEPKKKVKTMVIDNSTDDEKLRKFLEDLMKF